MVKETEPSEAANTKSEEAKAPETVTKDERGLLRILKSFFAGEEVEKGAVKAIVDGQENGIKLNKAFDALFQVLGLSRWGDITKEGPETDPAKIRAALTDFKNVAEKILIGKDEDVKKAVEEVQKSGRKISGPRLAKIKEVHAMLGDLIAETDSDSKEGEASEVTKEELAQEVKKSVDEAVKPLNERLDKLEKSETEADAAKVAEPETPDIGAVVKEAVEKAVAPINDRLEKIEKARGFSNRQTEETQVQKSEGDFWGNVFGA